MSRLLKNALQAKAKTCLTVGMMVFSFEVLSGVSSIPAPPVSVDSFILVDHQTGEVLAEKNADKSVEPASLVKIMTTYVAAQAIRDGHLKLTETTKVSKKAWKMEGSRMFIEVGTEVSIDDLLNGVIVQSGNDSSVALAEHLFGNEAAFVEKMNLEAKKLKMDNTSFGNVTGLPDRETYLSARDAVTLSRALIQKFPEIYSRFKLREFKYNNIKQRNRNALLFKDASVDGIKTGYTESAGYCLVTSAKKKSMRLVAAVMGARSNYMRVKDSRTLLSYGFRFFDTREIFKIGEEIATNRVWIGKKDLVKAGVKAPVFLTLQKGKFKDMQINKKFMEPLKAPVERGQIIGKVEINLPDGTNYSEDIVALEAIEKAGFFGSIPDKIDLLLN